MEIPGFGANPLRLNPNTINAPQALPVNVPPQLDEKSTQKGDTKTVPLFPDQAPNKAIINKSQQSFTNLLTEIGVPNTPQNNDLAKSLASYGQPINKTTINQVGNALGNIMNQGPANIEAGLVLLINKLPVNPKNVDSVKEMITGGGLSQNFISINKDLQKLVDSFKDKDFVQSLETKIKLKQKNLLQSPDMMFEKTDLTIDKSINQNKQMSMNSDKKIDEMGIVKKNPFEEEFTEENPDNPERNFQRIHDNKSLVKNESSKQGFSLLNNIIENDNTLLNNQNKISDNALKDSKFIVNDLLNKAEKLNTTLSSIVNIDVLKNPANFPQHIALLKKNYADLEVDIKEMKEILESSFPELKEQIKNDDENIFTNLLKLVFDDGKANQVKKTNSLTANINLENDILKGLSESTKSIGDNIAARELLTKNQDCLCIPLVIPFNNNVYNVEIKINREDQSNKKAEIGEVPLKIQIAIETNTMGKVGVDMSNLKKDLQVNLNVDNINIKNIVTKKLSYLQNKLELLPFEVKNVTCNVNPKPDESPSILLPQKYRVMSMNRIDGIV